MSFLLGRAAVVAAYHRRDLVARVVAAGSTNSALAGTAEKLSFVEFFSSSCSIRSTA
jgi:hypothetical protein